MTPDPFDGTDPIDLAALPFDAAGVAAILFATTEADRWGPWFRSSGVVDGSRVSAGGPDALDAIWGGVLEAVARDWFAPCSWDELVAAGPVPLWCRLRPGYEEYFGAAGCWVTAGVIALTGRWIERTWSGRWMLPPDQPGAERSEPALAIPGGRGIAPQVQIVSIVGAAVGLHGTPQRDPQRLRDLVFRHAPAAADGSGAPADPQGPAVSRAWEPDEWLVSFSDVQAHDEDARIDRFASALALLGTIERAYREDRDLVVVESALDLGRVREAVDEVWGSTAT